MTRKDLGIVAGLTTSGIVVGVLAVSFGANPGYLLAFAWGCLVGRLIWHFWVLAAR